MVYLESLFLTVIIRSIIIAIPAILLLCSSHLLLRRYRALTIQRLSVAVAVIWLVPVEKIISGIFAAAYVTPVVRQHHLSENVGRVVYNAGYSEVSNIIWGQGDIYLSTRGILALIWLSGCILSLAWHLFSHFKFIRLCRKWEETVVDERIMNILEKQHTLLNLKTNCNVKYCELAPSPLIIGLFKPKIYLPPAAKELCDEELAFILKHELIHYKKLDNWAKGLFMIVVSVYWFQPAVWLLAKASLMYGEIACDEEVVMDAAMEVRQSYGETIIGAICNQTKVPSSFVHHFYGGKTGMKKRLFSIMDFNKKKNGMIPGLIAAAFIFGIVLAPTGVRAISTENSEKAAAAAYEAASSDQASGGEYAYDSAESTTWFQDVYGEFGLVQKGHTLYYEGKRVRCFADKDESDKESMFSGSISQDATGDIDVVTVKDKNGKVTGLKALELKDTEDYIKQIYND